MSKLALVALVIVLTAAALTALMFYRVAKSVPPAEFGRGTAVQACPIDKPNCVSSRNVEADFSVPAFVVTGTPDQMLGKLKAAILAEPRATIVFEDASHIDASFRSAFFGFTDDASFELDAATGTIHFRSKSRVGYSDLQVNAKRMDRIRAALRAN